MTIGEINRLSVVEKVRARQISQKEQAIRLVKKNYFDFGPIFSHQKLNEERLTQAQEKLSSQEQ